MRHSRGQKEVKHQFFFCVCVFLVRLVARPLGVHTWLFLSLCFSVWNETSASPCISPKIQSLPLSLRLGVKIWCLPVVVIESPGVGGQFSSRGNFQKSEGPFFFGASSAFNFSTQEAFHVVVFDVLMMTLSGRQRHYCPVDLNMTTIANS